MLFLPKREITMEHDDMTDHMPLHHYHHPHHYGTGHHEGLEELILSNAMHSGHSQIQGDIHNASINGLNATADAARDGVAATNNVGNLNLQSSERNGGETRSAVFQAAGAVKDQAAANANQAARDFANQNRELCEIRSELAQEFGDTRLEMCKQHADLARQADTLAAETRRQLAECCCEMKELVRAENSATRQLLQSNELDAANRRADQAQNELNLLKLQASVSVG